MTNVDVWLSMANRVEYLRVVKGCILGHGYIHHQLIRVQARGASWYLLLVNVRDKDLQ